MECRKGIRGGVGEGMLEGMKSVEANVVRDSVGLEVVKIGCSVIGL